jgi:endonuclease/exonuclease/phosphatase family metal-dependent hydrolase
MRVVTYNIRNGGGPSRLDTVLRVVDRLAPDVLALQELRGFTRPVAARIAAALGMRAYVAPSCFAQPVAVFVRDLTVLAAAPVRRPFHHAASRVVLRTAAGPLTVVSAHLHPHRRGARRREARRLAGAVRGRDLAIVCGDLNGLDPGTDHTDEIERLSPAYRVRHLRRDGTVDTRAVAELHDAGLVDLGDPSRATAPTALGGAEFSGMRLDYLFGTPAVAARLQAYRVVDGGAAETASDHYPVLVDLDLTAARS